MPAAATWPATLPDGPSKDGYQEGAPDNAIRTDMDAGPPKVRRRSTAGVRAFTMRLDLTMAQVETLDSFYTTSLLSGSLSFDGLDHPRLGSDRVWRFAGPPRYRNLGGDDWLALCELEVLP